MWAMGEDFSYGNANTWFKQIDKLIHYANMVQYFSEIITITGFGTDLSVLPVRKNTSRRVLVKC